MTIRECLKAAALACLLALASACGGGGDDDGGGDPPPSADTKPDAFAFEAVENLFMDMAVASKAIEVKGIDAAADVTVSGGKYAVNDQPFTDKPGKIRAGDKVRVLAVTSEDPMKVVKAVLDIGGVKGEFAVTTGPGVNFADINPEPFVLSEPELVEKGQTVASDAFTVAQTNAPAPISVTGGEYRIENGEFTSEPGIVLPGQRVQVRAIAPQADGAVHIVTLRIGGVSEAFALATAPAQGVPDTTPNVFVISPVAGAEPDTEVISEEVIITGISAAAPIAVEGGAYSVGGEFQMAPGEVTDGVGVRVSVRSSPVSGGIRVAKVSVGGLPGYFVVTTRAIPFGTDSEPDVDSFIFTSVETQELGVQVESEWKTLTRFDAPAEVRVEGGEYQIDNSAFTSQPQLILPGQSIRLRGTSPETAGETHTVTVNIGGGEQVFRIHSVASNPGNNPPVANAGPDKIISIADGQLVLDAAQSTDADLDHLTFDWYQIAGPAAADITDSGSQATVIFMQPGTYEFEVEVSDAVDVDHDQVAVTVEAEDDGNNPGSPPGIPTAVTATPGNAQVILGWSSVANAESYRIERSSISGGPYVQVGTTSATSFTDTGLENGNTYFYVVSAANSAGVSARSEEVSGAPESGVEICVANEHAQTVVAFDADAEGNVPPLRSLGNLTGMSNPQTVAFDRMNDEIYVTNTAPSPNTSVYPVVVYERIANGNVAPVRFIAGPATKLNDAVGVAVDPVNNEVFVSTGGVIHVFARTAHGNVAPLRTLNTCFDCESAIAVDPASNELFVTFGDTLRAYERTAIGNDGPLRTISGASSELHNPGSVFYDEVHDEIVVFSVDNSSILTFRRTDNGTNVFPKSQILTDHPAGLTEIRQLAVDGEAGEIFVASRQGVAVFQRVENEFQGMDPLRLISGRAVGVAVSPAHSELFFADASEPQLVVHAATATGDAEPLRVISGLDGGMEFPQDMATADGKIFVTNRSGESLQAEGFVTSFSNPWGSVPPTPVTTVKGSLTALDLAADIATNESMREIFVTNAISDAVTVYSFDADGDVPPVRTIAGDATGLSTPFAIAVDSSNNEIFVGNNNTKTITVYGGTATGNAAPLRKLGPSSVLGFPASIDIDEANGEIFVLSTDSAGKSILVFEHDGNGGAAIRKISGLSTLLDGASSIMVDTARDEIFVTNGKTSSVLVFPRTANGNVEPTRIISGDATGLSGPTGIDHCR